jgi:hypothetical protein
VDGVVVLLLLAMAAASRVLFGLVQILLAR